MLAKVLYINSDESDYGQDITYSGLVKILGKSNVLELPFNKNYHLPLRKYPRNLGYRSEGLLPRLAQSFSEIPWQEIDAVIVASAKPKTFETYLKILPKIPNHVSLIFIDGGDFPEVGGDLRRLKHFELFEQAVQKRPFDLIFKREMLIQEKYPKNVHPFPFGFNFKRLPHLKNNLKKYDVSFWAVESDPIRTQALSILENKFDCQANGTTRNQTFKKYKRKGLFYLEELQHCKIVLNFRGVGWDTLRYWEAPALGTFMISQTPQIEIPNNFRDGSEVVFVKEDLSNLIELCEYYLRNETLREKIAQNSKAWAEKYHSDIARAHFLLLELLKLRKGHL